MGKLNPAGGSGDKAKAGKGGSALKRLKASLKDAGVIGKHQKISKKKSATQRAAALSGRKEARDTLRQISSKAKDNNPFELKINRQKHEVIGRKVKGAAPGRPGLVRKRGEENRMRTLAVEMQRKNKDSAFVDRRFGEHDATMSVEDKMLERFMKEKSNRSSKGSMFNLDQDEDQELELTHMGQALNEDAFNDAGLHRVGSDAEDEPGHIDKDTVRYTHFGGFSDEEGEGEDDGTGKRKSKNEIMKEIIAKSKLHKRERQQQKEEDEDLADELDAQLDDIRSLLAPLKDEPRRGARDSKTGATDSNMVPVSDKRGRNASTAEVVEEENKVAKPAADYDDYDQFVRELASERRAKPTDRLKTEEEQAADEKARLEQLERDRKRRMMGLPTEQEEKAQKMAARLERESSGTKRPAEADDLGDDDYVTAVDEMVENEEEMPLTYRDGKLMNKEVFMRKKRKLNDDEEESEDSDDEDSDDEDDEDDDEHDDNEGEEEGSMLEESEEDDEEGEDVDADGLTENWVVEDMVNMGDEPPSPDSDDEAAPASAHKLPFKKDAAAPGAAAAAKELPYIFEAPTTVQDFSKLMEDRNPEEQATIVQRIRVLHHVKLGGDNRKTLENLLDILFKHVSALASPQADRSTTGAEDLNSINALSVHIIELCHQFPEQASTHFIERLTKLQKRLVKDLSSPSAARRNGAWPSLDALFTLRFISRVFSTSDLVHPVVTPALLLMGQYLSQCPVAGFRGTIAGLYLCDIVHEFEVLSKRYVPEVINFIATTLALALPLTKSEDADEEGTTVFETVPILEARASFLRIEDFPDLNAAEVAPMSLKLLSTDNVPVEESIDLSMRQSILFTALTMLGRFARLHMNQPSYIEVFTPFANLLATVTDSLPTGAIPALLTSTHKQLTTQFATHTLKRRPLLLQKFKPIPISTFVPKFDTNYSIDRKSRSSGAARDPNRERVEAAKLKYEYKQEFKGAVRELRKDAAFVARKRLAAVKEKDVEYKKKMDKIMGQLANQEGAMRGYERDMKKAKGKRR